MSMNATNYEVNDGYNAINVTDLFANMMNYGTIRNVFTYDNLRCSDFKQIEKMRIWFVGQTT